MVVALLALNICLTVWCLIATSRAIRLARAASRMAADLYDIPPRIEP